MAPQGGLGNSQDPGRLSRHRVHPPRGKVRQNSAVLLALAGMELEGGIASVCRAMARALDAEVDAGRLAVVDRVLLHDVPAHAPQPPARGTQWLARGSQPLFAAQLWARWLWRRHELIVFDQVGPARSLRLPLPGLPTPRYAIFCHGGELERSEKEPLASAMCGAWRLLTNSAHTGRDVTRRFPDLESRVRVTPLCIDPRRIATWEPLGLPDASAKREPAVLIVGRLWAEEQGKGHDALIEAWPDIRRRIPDARLWIVGDGDDRERLEAKAREAGLADCVDFFRRVSDLELSRLYRRASLFAMPSRQEGFGLVYAEALWHGLPCIGSTADAAPEVIDSERTGRLVPYGDPAALAVALAELLADPALRRRWAEEGMRQARERFGYERFRRDLLDALDIGEH